MVLYTLVGLIALTLVLFDLLPAFLSPLFSSYTLVYLELAPLLHVQTLAFLSFLTLLYTLVGLIALTLDLFDFLPVFLLPLFSSHILVFPELELLLHVQALAFLFLKLLSHLLKHLTSQTDYFFSVDVVFYLLRTPVKLLDHRPLNNLHIHNREYLLYLPAIVLHYLFLLLHYNFEKSYFLMQILRKE